MCAHARTHAHTHTQGRRYKLIPTALFGEDLEDDEENT